MFEWRLGSAPSAVAWAVGDGAWRTEAIAEAEELARRCALALDNARLTSQLTLAVGYCELLAHNPELPPQLRAQALGAMQGAQGAAATLEAF